MGSPGFGLSDAASLSGNKWHQLAFLTIAPMPEDAFTQMILEIGGFKCS